MSSTRPTFQRHSDQPLLTTAEFNWDIGPRRTIMFPCLVPTRDTVANPLAAYYLYFAAHNGNGIALALADAPTGPWRMHQANPVYHLTQATECREHISSPEVVWRPDLGQFLLYYHGPNAAGGGQQTSLAASADGLHFEPLAGNPIIANGPAGSWTHAMAAYLRVLPVGDRWYGIYMGHKKDYRADGVPISPQLVARSDDGLRWQADPNEVILAAEHLPSGEHARIRHVGLVGDGAGGAWCLHSTYAEPDCRTEALALAHVTFGEPGACRAERYGIVMRPELPWEGRDLRDPCLLVENDTLWLVYIGGGEAGLAVASTPWPLTPAG